jgi:hypothetical protein
VISQSYFIFLGKTLKESEGRVLPRRGCGCKFNHVNELNVRDLAVVSHAFEQNCTSHPANGYKLGVYLCK